MKLRAGLIGAGIGASRFGAALDLLCQTEGIALDYTPIDTAALPGFDLAGTVDRLRAEGWTGVSVTHPFKPAAAALAGAAMDPALPGLGACNLLTFDPALRGWNTDFSGTVAAWRAAFGTRRPGRVALAGAGGVARAIAPALLDLGAERLEIWDTDPAQATALARDLGDRAHAIPATGADAAIRAADGLVNATPLGMTGHPGTAFAPTLIGGQAWAFDAVYTPTDTRFLQAAASAGLATLSGFDLFRCMALASFRIYTGHTPDPATALPLLDRLRPKETA